MSDSDIPGRPAHELSDVMPAVRRARTEGTFA